MSALDLFMMQFFVQFEQPNAELSDGFSCASDHQLWVNIFLQCSIILPVYTQTPVFILALFK